MPRPIHFEIQAENLADASATRIPALGGTIVAPTMPIPTVGWLAYARDTEGNLFGFMQMDANAK